MYYSEGRLYGNIGTYVVDEARDAWDAERLIRNATAIREQVQFSRPIEASTEKEDIIYDALEHASDPNSRNKVYNLGYDVDFLEFITPEDLFR